MVETMHPLVTGGGQRLIGIGPIAAFTAASLPGAMARGSVTYEVEHVAMISADVALTATRPRRLPTCVQTKGRLTAD
jgi:hypothetical protein